MPHATPGSNATPRRWLRTAIRFPPEANTVAACGKGDAAQRVAMAIAQLVPEKQRNPAHAQYRPGQYPAVDRYREEDSHADQVKKDDERENQRDQSRRDAQFGPVDDTGS